MGFEDSTATVTWRAVDNLYFETAHPGFGEPILGLLGTDDGSPLPVNNFHYLGDLFGKGSGNIISVTSLQTVSIDSEEGETAIRGCLEGIGIEVGQCIRRETVRKRYQGIRHPSHTLNRQWPGKPSGRDHLLYPSFQGAYDSGVQAAETILKRNAHGEPHGANS